MINCFISQITTHLQLKKISDIETNESELPTWNRQTQKLSKAAIGSIFDVDEPIKSIKKWIRPNKVDTGDRNRVKGKMKPIMLKRMDGRMNNHYTIRGELNVKNKSHELVVCDGGKITETENIGCDDGSAEKVAVI